MYHRALQGEERYSSARSWIKVKRISIDQLLDVVFLCLVYTFGAGSVVHNQAAC